jgi:hypothetical protein
MSALLRGARVFSNETENNASVKQEMSTNINVKLKPTQTQEQQSPIAQPIMSPPSYPSIQPDINFINNPDLVYQDQAPDPQTPLLTSDQLRSPYHVHKLLHPKTRTVDIEENGRYQEQENKIKVLEALLTIYESAPVLVKGCLIISQKKLISIIQLLTDCETIELICDDVNLGCCGSSKVGFVAVSKIFCVKDGHRTEFKQSFNEEYSLLLRHSVNLKLVRLE